MLFLIFCIAVISSNHAIFALLGNFNDQNSNGNQTKLISSSTARAPSTASSSSTFTKSPSNHSTTWNPPLTITKPSNHSTTSNPASSIPLTAVNPSNSSTTRNPPAFIPFTTLAIKALASPTTSASSSTVATVTASDSGTVIAALGTTVVGVGAGGFFIVNGETFPIAGGVEAVIQESVCGVNNIAKRCGCGEEVVFKAADDGNVEEEKKEEEERLSTSPSKTWTTSTSTLSSTTSSSTLSSTMPTTYLIYPKDSVSQGDLSAFSNTLQKQLGQENVEILPDRNKSVLLWIVKLTLSQLKIVSSSQIVSCLFVKGRLDTKYL